MKMNGRRITNSIFLIFFLIFGLFSHSPVWAGNNLWTGKGPNGGDVRDVAWHPTDSGIAYAATPQNGVFKTSDGGQSWQAVNEGIAFPNGDLPFIAEVAVDLNSPQTVYAAGISTMYKSTDGGASWSSFLLALSNTEELIIDPSNSDILYICGLVGVQRSADGGETWAVRNNGLTSLAVYDIEFDANLGNVLYVATGDGVFKTVDNATNWNLTNTGVVGQPLALAVDPSAPAPGTLYAMTSNRVYKSTDGGANWTNSSTGFSGSSHRDIAVDPSAPLTLYAGENGEVFKTTDGAATWNQSDSGLLQSFIQSVEVSPASGDVMLGTIAGAWGTSDGGANWSERSGGLLNTIARDIAFDPFNLQIMYATTASGLYKTIDRGDNWFRLTADLPNTATSGIASDSAGVLYVTHNSGGIFRSTNGGVNWTDIRNDMTTSSVITVEVVPGSTTNLFAGTRFGMFSTVNTGTNWTLVGGGLPIDDILSIKIDPLTPSNMYVTVARLNGNLYKSSDGGATWGLSQSGITASFVSDIAIDPVTPSTLYAITNGGVFKSTDSGATWSPSSTGMGTFAGNGIGINPGTPTTIFASNFQGIYISTDSGANWSLLDDGVTPIGNREASAFGFAPLDNSTLHAGMDRLGVQSYTFAGPGITVLPTNLSISEPAGSDTFIVRLDTDPTDPVSINLATSNGECSTDLNMVVLDATTRFETITVSAVDDVVVDGELVCTIQVQTAMSDDLDYDGLDPDDVTVMVADDDTAGILVSPQTLTVNEPDGSDTFDITVQTPPLEDVTITLNTSNGECMTTVSEVTLTAGAPTAIVTVEAVEDLLLDGDQECTVMTGASDSLDPAYDNLDAADVTVTVVDTDVPGITVTPLDIDVPENGSNSFTISLDTIPDDDVEIGLSPATGACSVGVVSVTLTPGSISQMVTVFGIDDLMIGGNQGCGIITNPADSTDPNYDLVNPDNVVVTVTDTTVAGIQVAPLSGLVTDEDGTSDTFDVVLTSIPALDVTIEFMSDNFAEGTVAPSMLTFTPGNALLPQTVTVTGVPDGVIDPDVMYQIITNPTQSSDGNFDGLNPPDVSVTNEDTDDNLLIQGFEDP